MWTYLCFVFVLLSFTTIFDLIGLQKRDKLPFYILGFIALWFAAGFRSGDRDYLAYIEAFNVAPNWDTERNFMEPGYLFLNYLMKLIGLNAEEFIAFFAFLSVGVITSFLYRYNKFVMLALLIYMSHVFVLRDMIQIRSSFAIGICMFSIPYIANRNFKGFLFVMLFASLFHFVSLFWSILYFSYPYLQKTKWQVRFLILGFLLGLVLNLNFFQLVLSYMNVNILQLYLVDSRYNQELGLFNPVLIKHYLVLLIIFFNKEKLRGKIPYFEVFVISYVVAAFWLSAFNSFAIFSGRIATLFSHPEHILIPSLLYLEKAKYAIYIFIILYTIVAFSAKYSEIELMNFVFTSNIN